MILKLYNSSVVLNLTKFFHSDGEKDIPDTLLRGQPSVDHERVVGVSRWRSVHPLLHLQLDQAVQSDEIVTAQGRDILRFDLGQDHISGDIGGEDRRFLLDGDRLNTILTRSRAGILTSTSLRRTDTCEFVL